MPTTGVVHDRRPRRRHRAREHVHRQAAFDGAGSVYAATSRGLWKHAATTDAGAWTRVLYPGAGSVVNGVAASRSAVALQQHLQRRRDPAGQRRPARASPTAPGAAAPPTTASTLRPTAARRSRGSIPTARSTRRTSAARTFAYSADGSQLYALVESMTHYTNSNQTALGGVYVSPSGNVDGPVEQDRRLAASSPSKGSALKNSVGLPARHPGLVQPVHRRRSRRPEPRLRRPRGGLRDARTAASHWTTIGPYWNFDFRCWSVVRRRNTCPPTTHSDQHSIAIRQRHASTSATTAASTARPLSGTVNANGNATDWAEPEREPPHAAVLLGRRRHGAGRRRGVAAGCRTTAARCCCPRTCTGNGKMGSPFGGDGGDTLVDPTTAARSSTSTSSSRCGDRELRPVGRHARDAIRDVSIRAIRSRGSSAPFDADAVNKNHWIAGGQYVWQNDEGLRDPDRAPTGRRSSTTAPATRPRRSRVRTAWSGPAWCGPCNTDGLRARRLDQRRRHWHQLTLPATLPNRYISALAIDPADASGSTAYLGFNGFSRRWIEGPGRRPRSSLEDDRRRRDVDATSAATCRTCR